MRLWKEPTSSSVAGQNRGRPKALPVEVETFIGDEIKSLLEKRSPSPIALLPMLKGAMVENGHGEYLVEHGSKFKMSTTWLRCIILQGFRLSVPLRRGRPGKRRE